LLPPFLYGKAVFLYGQETSAMVSLHEPFFVVDFGSWRHEPWRTFFYMKRKLRISIFLAKQLAKEKTFFAEGFS